jgi:NAD(P)-dependent dehydrogenase (short-subunit alcohol dehydrogenase family)
MRLDGELALVTGAARGLGAAIATRLAADGATVAVADIDGDGAEAVARTLGPQHLGVAVDVRTTASVEAAVAAVTERATAPTILVNNAGINRVGPSETLSDEDWLQVVEVNLQGTFRCCRAVGAQMLAAGRGAIVNIASANAALGSPGRAAYCASKTGVVGLTRALGVEWAPRGVRVNAVSPGYMSSPMLHRCFETGLIDQERLLDRIPAGRLGGAEEVAAAVAFLVSPDAEYVTAHVLSVDGGFIPYGAPAPASQPPRTDVKL